MQPVGNYAVQISWADGFSQIAAYDLLDALPRLSADDARVRQGLRARLAAADAGSGGVSAAQQILQNAQPAAASQA